MATHTPGPWTVERGQSLADGSHAFDVMAPDQDVNASKGDLTVVAAYLTAANARLIAASPDLLAACKRGLDALSCAVEVGGGDPQTHESCCQMRAAIALAKP